MNASDTPRTYCRADCVTFRKTGERFGGLSNMAPGYPVRINGVRVFTVEALYQACRFPHRVDVQQLIIGQHSPMTAKMVSKPYREDSRADWDRVRVKIMRWCLRLKLAMHWPKFSQLLLSTGNRPIVEDSRKDAFWGAIPADSNTLIGMNVLGRLLMELRETIKSGAELRLVEPPPIPNFSLFGEPLTVVDFRGDKNAPIPASSKYAELFDGPSLSLSVEPVATPPAFRILQQRHLQPSGKPSIIQGLTPFGEYKVSGQRWLGEIPSSWEVRRAKYLFREVDERSATGKEELLSVSHKTGVTPRSQKNVTMFMAASNVGHKICRPNDLVINTLWAWMAALGVTKYQGLVSPAYGVYRPLQPQAFLPRFADLLLRTPAYAAEYQRCSTGVNSSRLRLYPESFLRIPVVLPSTDEQAAIVRFLDHANRKIEAFARAKKRELSLITEMLLTITEQSLMVPNAQTVRLSTAAKVIFRAIDRRAMESFTRIGLFNRGRGIFHKPPVSGAELGDSDFFWVEDGDIVISGQFAWEGAVALARQKDSRCVASHRYPILRGRENYIISPALLSILRTKFGGMLLDHHSRGAAGRNRPLNINTLLKEKIPIPPLSDQLRIAELLEQEYAVSQSVARSIRLVNEYRTRLTNDIVMGRLDVRNAASDLSDLPADVAEKHVGADTVEEFEADEVEA